MPQYQEIDRGPSAAAQAAGSFGQSFSQSLKKAREQQAQSDMLNQILYPEGRPSSNNPTNAPNSMQGPSYLGEQQGAPDNITPTLENISQHPDTLAKQGIVAGKNPESAQTNRLSPQKMAQIQVIAPEVAKALQPVYENQTAKEKEGLKSDVKRSTEFLTKADHIREGLPRKELALRQIDHAIASGTTIDTIKNQLADITGLESMRSASGAELRSATKEFFLSDLASIPGVRPNQFLEKALSSAMTDDSRQKEANEMLAAGMRSNLELDKTKDALTSQYEEHYRNQLGYIPASISKDVNKALAPYAQQIQDQWANNVQHILEKNRPEIQKFKKVADDPIKRKNAAKNVKLKEAIPGSVLDETMGMILLEKYGDDEQKAIEAAERLGYKIPGAR